MAAEYDHPMSARTNKLGLLRLQAGYRVSGSVFQRSA
jgi:hypothetical protein